MILLLQLLASVLLETERNRYKPPVQEYPGVYEKPIRAEKGGRYRI
jgi:hypothetical protein